MRFFWIAEALEANLRNQPCAHDAPPEGTLEEWFENEPSKKDEADVLPSMGIEINSAINVEMERLTTCSTDENTDGMPAQCF